MGVTPRHTISSSYAHDRERRFILGVTSHLEDHAQVKNANQKAQMAMTDHSDRQLNDTSVYFNVAFNSSANSGGDQLNHSFESETPH